MIDLIDYVKNVKWEDVKDLDGKFSKFNFVSLVNLPEKFPSILYIVIINKLGRNKYFGFDTKGFDGTYIGSLVTNKKQFEKDIADYDWRCVCVAYGDKGIMAKKEKEVLETIDAKDRKNEFYNASNGGSKFMKGYSSVDILEKIIDKLKNGEYKKVSELKEKVHAIVPHQVREIANGSTKSKEKVKEILYKLQDTKGKWLKENAPGVLTLKDWFDLGEHLRVGTYHGTEASMKCDYVSNLDVIYIPKEDWFGINEIEIDDLGLYDNKKGDNLQDYTSQSEAVSNCVLYCEENNCDQNDVRVENKLLRWGFGPSEITTIKASMRKKMVSQRIIPIGHARINRTKQELEDLAKENSNKHTHCFVMNTTNYAGKWNNWEVFIDQTQIKEATKKPNWLICWVHETDASYDNWSKVPPTKRDKNGNEIIQPTKKTKVESKILQLAKSLNFTPTIIFKDLEYTKLKTISKTHD